MKELNRNLIDDRMQDLEPGTQVRVIVVPIINKDEQIEKDLREYLDGLRRETGWFIDATVSAPFASLMPMPNAVTKFIKEELDPIVDRLVDNFKKSDWNGVRRWARAFGQI